jgi:hypothetical protein
LAGAATYALRNQTVEPVFGIIKSVMGVRQFSLRGLKKVTGEWNLVCLAWNVKRMARATSENGLKGRIGVKDDQIHRNIANIAFF